MEHLCKVVNFDEESVTDYVQIVVGGELENTTELLNSRDAEEKQELQANGKIGVGLKVAFYSSKRLKHCSHNDFSDCQAALLV